MKYNYQIIHHFYYFNSVNVRIIYIYTDIIRINNPLLETVNS
jgi:hypothetical protein